jgi:hypothetical protein
LKLKNTQKDLASYIKVDPDTITNWKKNKPELFALVWNSWIDYIQKQNMEIKYENTKSR